MVSKLFSYRCTLDFINVLLKKIFPFDVTEQLKRIASIVLFFGVLSSYAQQPYERVYATVQTNGGTLITTNVSNAGLAIDGDMTTHSSLTITALGNVWQQLEFVMPPDPNDDVHVKIGTSTGLLGLLNGLTLQAYNGGSSVGSSIQLGSLISLINGETQEDVVFPAPGQAYNSIRITYSGIALGGGIDVYGAYYKQETTAVACNEAGDFIWGSTGGLLGGLNPVEDPEHAVDGDYTTYTNLRSNVGVADKTFVTAIYDTDAQAGDSIRVVFQNPGPGLIDASVLAASLTIRTYYDNTNNGALTLDPSLLGLSLLGGSGDIQVLSYPIAVPFNRIEVALGEGLVSALESLYVHEIEKVPQGPGVVSEAFVVCPGEDVTLEVENPTTGSIYNWYDEYMSTTPLATGTSYTTTISTLGAHLFYVAEIREDCTDESGRTFITVMAYEVPDAPDVVINPIIVDSGDNAFLEIDNPESHLEYYWYDEAANLLGSGTSITIPNVTTETTVYVEAAVGDNCVSDTQTEVIILLSPELLPPDVTPTTATINEGGITTYTAETDYPNGEIVWYDENGTVVYIGEEFTVGPGLPPGTYTYTVVVVDPNTNEESDPVTITLEVLPSAVPTDCLDAYERIYAATQTTSGSVNNASNAIDGDLESHSSIVIPSLGLTAYQELSFGSTFNPSNGDRLHVKIGTDVGLTVGSITLTLRAYNTGTAVGTPIQLSSGLLNLLAGENQADIIIPDPGASFDAVRVSVGGGLLSGGQIHVYEAYVNQETNTLSVCNTVEDILHGVTSGLLGTLNGVTDAENVADEDMNTYALIRQNVGVAGHAHVTTIYSAPSVAGDSIRVTLSEQNAGLLDLSVAQGITIQTYLGNTPVEAVDVVQGLLDIKLLSGAGNIYEASTDISQPFDRISIQLGGLVNALEGINVYEIEHVASVSVENGDGNNHIGACTGETISLLPPDNSCTTYVWYDERFGGTVIGTDNLTFEVPVTWTPGEHVVWVQPVRYGCENMGRNPVTIQVSESPTADDIDLVADSSDYCVGDDVTITATASDFTDPIFNWYLDPGKEDIVVDDGTVTYVIVNNELTISGLPEGNHTYYVSVKEGNDGCENPAGDLAEITFSINDADTPTTTDTQQTFCTVDNPTVSDIQVNETGVIWYDTATGGTVISPTDALVDGQTYYAVLISAEGCESSIRLEVTITIEDAPTPTTTDTQQTFCTVDIPTIDDLQVNETGVIWYDAPTGGTAYASTDALVDGQSYFAALVSAGGCESSIRLEIEVAIEDAATPTTTDAQQTFCTIDNPTIDDLQVNETGAIWYDAPTGGTAYTSTDALVDGQSYYAALVSTGGCESSIRLEIAVTIEDAPTPTTTDIQQTFCSIDNPTIDDLQANETGVIWYDAPTGGTAYTSTDALVDGQSYFAALVSAGGCESSTRLEVAVTIEDAPTPTTTDTQQTFCTIDIPTIDDLQVNETGVIWYDAPTGGTAYASADVLVDGQSYYAALVSAGGCESSVRLQVTVSIEDTPTPTTTDVQQTFCSIDNPTIDDLQVNETGAIWYDTPTGGTAYASTDALVDGQSYYAALVSAGGCESSIRLEVTVLFLNEDNATITSDNGGQVCLETIVTYSTETGQSNYIWTVTGGIVFGGGGLNDDFVEVLWDSLTNTSVSVSYDNNTACLNGDTVIYDEIVNVCADITISKTVDEPEPMVGDNVTFTITVTNLGPNDFTDVEISEHIPSGYSLVNYSPSIGQYSPVTGIWMITLLPADEVATLEITVEVLGTGDYLNSASIITSNPVDSDTGNNTAEVSVLPQCLFVYNEFSPNNDGINDFFVISCIENFPNNELKVFNRYGSLVFKQAGYSNNWDGIANVSGVAKKGEVLPSDTYYYVLETDKDTKPKTGWLFLLK